MFNKYKYLYLWRHNSTEQLVVPLSTNLQKLLKYCLQPDLVFLLGRSSRIVHYRGCPQEGIAAPPWVGCLSIASYIQYFVSWPNSSLAGTYLYTPWIERGTVRVTFLTQERKTVMPARAWTWTTHDITFFSSIQNPFLMTWGSMTTVILPLVLTLCALYLERNGLPLWLPKQYTVSVCQGFTKIYMYMYTYNGGARIITLTTFFDHSF